MNVYEAFIAEVDALTIRADDRAVAVVGELTRAVKRAQMVVDGELRPIAERAPRKITVRLFGGPWNGTVEVDHVVGPVFAVGDPIGNHYWLDSKSDPPTYWWRGGEPATDKGEQT